MVGKFGYKERQKLRDFRLPYFLYCCKSLSLKDISTTQYYRNSNYAVSGGGRGEDTESKEEEELDSEDLKAAFDMVTSPSEVQQRCLCPRLFHTHTRKNAYSADLGSLVISLTIISTSLLVRITRLCVCRCGLLKNSMESLHSVEPYVHDSSDDTH